MKHQNIQQNVIDGRYGIVSTLLENGSTVINKIKQSSNNRKLAGTRNKRHFNEEEIEEFRIPKRDAWFFRRVRTTNSPKCLGPSRGKKSSKSLTETICTNVLILFKCKL